MAFDWHRKHNKGLENAEDARGARSMLTAAGLTYLAAAVSSIIQLLYLIGRAQSR